MQAKETYADFLHRISGVIDFLMTYEPARGVRTREGFVRGVLAGLRVLLYAPHPDDPTPEDTAQNELLLGRLRELHSYHFGKPPH